ncbi:ATP-binding protein [Candidatus Palauibacter sp.]|uniref:ATP-binding protein n=1 Tax=Candidatus Palauibacter sp. TaxID=3101350 RepID=UPI003B010630
MANSQFDVTPFLTRTRLDPPQPSGFTVPHEGVELIVFDVPAADAPVQMTGNGFPLRVGDQTVRARETQIAATKQQGMYESWESRRSSCSLEDLDPKLLARARAGAGLSALSDEEYLLKRKLADLRGRRIVLRRAAELLFARHDPDHPNAGVRVFRVIGTERRFGAEHNVEERPRIEGSLPRVLDEAHEVVSGLLRRPSRMVGMRFREMPEYPDFAWREALHNAVAHRDYAIQGSGAEIWLFEDRMEVVSAGRLPEGVTLEEVLRLERVHRSRNPRIVRVLVDLGFAKDQGESIPRMFAEMEDAFLPQPELEVGGERVIVTLRNTSTLTASDRQFVASLGNADLSRHEFRALLMARRRGRVDNAALRSVTGLDTLRASHLLRGLRDRELLTLQGRGADSSYTLTPVVRDLAVDRGELPDGSGGAAGRIGGSSGADRGELPADRGELPADRGSCRRVYDDRSMAWDRGPGRHGYAPSLKQSARPGNGRRRETSRASSTSLSVSSPVATSHQWWKPDGSCNAIRTTPHTPSRPTEPTALERLLKRNTKEHHE